MIFVDNGVEEEEEIFLDGVRHVIKMGGVDTENIDYINESCYAGITIINTKSGDSFLAKREFDVMFNWLQEIKRKEKWLAFLN